MKICVTALLVVVLANQSAAQEIAIVFPAEYENTEAPGEDTAGGVILEGVVPILEILIDNGRVVKGHSIIGVVLKNPSV